MEATLNVDLQLVAREVGLPLENVRTTVELLDEGNTVPFITRYRKDQSGGLNEEQIRCVQQTVKKLRTLVDRKQRILKSLESQGKLTDELVARIQAAESLRRLEDLYLPFKPKKQTLAAAARARGLEPLAQEILKADPVAADLQARAAEYLSEEKGVPSAAEAVIGAGHVIAEQFNEDLPVRDELRDLIQKTGKLVSTRIEEPPDAPEPEAGDKTEAEPAKDAPRKAADSESVVATTTQSEAAVPQVDAPESPAELAAEAPLPAERNVQPAPGQSAELDGADLQPRDDAAGDQNAASPAMPDGGSSAEDAATVPADIAPSQSVEDDHADAQSDRDTTQAPTQSDASQDAPTGEPAASAAADNQATPKPKLTIKEIAAKSRKEAKKRKRQKKVESFKDYFKYQEPLAKVPPHRLLAINRGDRSKILRVKIDADMDAVAQKAEQLLVPPDHPHAEFLRGCVRDALTRLIYPSLEREIRRELTEKAESHAVQVFARNLRQLLLQPPVRDRRVLAIDPGFRSGCKLAALDEFGNVLGHTVIHVIGKADIVRRGRQQMLEMITMYHIPVIAIGNGTACRETERLVADMIAKELKERDVQYVIVNEAGASVYSTSPLGREELPKFDPVLRSAISIGRRLQDPLSELVKINPANIGVGLYQHDVRAKHLEESLDAVVESCVNFVGVDVNTASPSLLRYVSGLNQLTARRLYEYRQKHGPFRSRTHFKDVPGFGDATFVQAAGFLKIMGGDNPLDSTWIHPESYEVAERVIGTLGGRVEELAAGQPDANKPATSRTTDRTSRGFGEGVPAGHSATSQQSSTAADAMGTVAACPAPVAGEVNAAAQRPGPLTGLVERARSEASPALPAEPSTVKPPESESAQRESAPNPSAAATTPQLDSPEAVADEPVSPGVEQPKPEAEQPEAGAPESVPPEPPTSKESPTGPDSPQGEPPLSLARQAASADVGTLVGKLGVGQMLLRDILSSLTRPGRDPREDLPPPAFRREIIKLEHLQPGMELTGTILNVVDFGAFVDIGLPDSGLIHISRLADRFIRDPHEVVSVGDILPVWVVEVDKQRRRVSLTAIKPGTERPAEERGDRPARSPKREQKQRKPDGRRGEAGRGKRARSERPKGRATSKPAPARPITDAMVEGKEPMRSFSDLLQFHERKKGDKKKKKP
jgi:uncharacterized protein